MASDVSRYDQEGPGYDRERTAAIVARVKAGESMAQVARDYGVSRTRIRQIVCVEGRREAERHACRAAGAALPLRERPILVLGLSTKAHLALYHSDVTTVGALLDKTDAELLAIRNFGRLSLREVREALAEVERVALAVRRWR